ncbi:MAG: flagellar hook-length control protein FliK [Oscillospiraceae bacterium]|nr:flagellar hook-length control protein FliK [Oscillospiraceae bacterium]
MEGKVISTDQDGQIALRLTDGSLLRARLESDVIPPLAGESVTLQVAEPMGKDGILRLRLVELESSAVAIQNAAVGGAVIDGSAMTQSGGIAKLLAQLRAQSPELFQLVSDLAQTLQNLGLPVTEKNLNAMQEIAAAPTGNLPVESEVIASAAQLIPAESVLSGQTSENAVKTNIPAVTLTPELAAVVAKTPETVPVTNNAAAETAATLIADADETASAPLNENVPAAKISQDVPKTETVPNAAVDTRVPESGGASVNAIKPEPNQARENSIPREIAPERADAQPIKAEITNAQIVQAGNAQTEQTDAKLLGGAALKRAAFELPARLVEIERGIEREIAKLPPDDTKSAELKLRHSELQTIREQLTDTRMPDNKFIYAQIPLNINEHRTTAELYVYKNPKSGRTRIDPENANILLSLDLEKFGHIETLISVRGKELSLNFGAELEETVNSLKRESIGLYSVMKDVGFKLTGVSASRIDSPSKPAEAMLKTLVSANKVSRGLDIMA